MTHNQFFKSHLSITVLVEFLEVFPCRAWTVLASRACLEFIKTQRAITIGIQLLE